MTTTAADARTVKPPYSGRMWAMNFVAVIERWLFNRDSNVGITLYITSDLSKWLCYSDHYTEVSPYLQILIGHVRQYYFVPTAESFRSGEGVGALDVWFITRLILLG